MQRRAADLAPPWWLLVLAKAALLVGGLGLLTYYVNIDRGFSFLWWLLFALVVVVDFALRRTVWGRHVFAVVGNVEAARRSGIRVDRVFVSVFVLTSRPRSAVSSAPGSRRASRRPPAPETPT